MKLFRFHGLVWIIGIVLLVGTLAGAGWILNGPIDPKTNPVTVPFDGDGISTAAYVDVEPGVSQLFPARPGEVVWITPEGKDLKKGDLLLQIDDRLAQAELEKAKLALQIAERTVAKAKRGAAVAKLALKEAKDYPEVLASKIRQQKAQIKVFEKDEARVRDRLNTVTNQVAKKVLQQTDLDEATRFHDKALALVEVGKEQLKQLQLIDPQNTVKKAEENYEIQKIAVLDAESDKESKAELLKQARLAVDQHKKLAPVDGKVLRVNTRIGEVFGPHSKMPAIEFCPALPRIIRAEVQQQWATSIKKDQECVIEDDTSSKHQWRGKVVRISDWIAAKRSIIREPFQFNDVRTLECIISITETPERPLRIGQRMRVMINQGGP